MNTTSEGLIMHEQSGVGLVVSAAEHAHVTAALRGKIFALEKAGEAMNLLLTGSMKPSKGVREAWESAKKL